MSPLARRVRGLLIRAVLRRWPALLIGAVLVGPSVMVMFVDFSWESAVTDGLALVFGATGAAFILAAVAGRRADWINPEP